MSIAEIERALNSLVGLRWQTIGRASHLLWLNFGEMREVPARGGGSKSVWRWAIHVQCPWRILAEGKVVLSSNDYHIDSRGNPVADQPDRLAQSRFDDVASLMCDDFKLNAPAVVLVKGSQLLGFSLSFSDGTQIDVVPDACGEAWRMFEPSTDKPHFIARF